MIKKLISLTLFLGTAFPFFTSAGGNELELGISIVPLGIISEYRGFEVIEDATDSVPPGFLEEWLLGIHLAYNLGVIYASLDIFHIPPALVTDITTPPESLPDSKTIEPIPTDGNPGFYNFLDLGVKLSLSKIVVFAEGGINHLLLYSAANPEEMQPVGVLGGNLRFGVSYKLSRIFSIGFTGTALFTDFKTMNEAIQGALGVPQYTDSARQVKFLPILIFVLYV